MRPASERKKPFRDMIETVEQSPSSFHLKNRGIIYRCEKFEYERTLRVTIPDIPPSEFEDLENGEPKFGIADGGHTFEVIQQTVGRMNELSEREGWKEPYVRVHFLAGEALDIGELEQVVEALNTSSQVQQFTLDEYQNRFDELKEALQRGAFDIGLIAFRENEEKEWDVREIIQRMACFLKDRWKSVQPASMYRSKGKALDMFTTEGNEFRKLYDVVVDVIALPEFIQSEFSRGDSVKGRRFGKLRAVRTLKKPHARPGTAYTTDHEMDLAASLPIRRRVPRAVGTQGRQILLEAGYKEVFKVAAEELYRALLNKSRTAKAVNSLGTDTEYWTQAANIILRAKDDVLSKPAKSA
ncbi:MAG: AIPR family protein [Bryobacteraceae bacterium]